MEIPASALEKYPLRVLIVDDEPLIRWSLAETLEEAGYNVREMGDARSTLRYLSTSVSPDVILLDLRLPDSNDLGLLEAIRRMVPASPVIMMTAYGTPEMLDGAARLGAYQVLNKPLDLTDLVPLVERAAAVSSQ